MYIAAKRADFVFKKFFVSLLLLFYHHHDDDGGGVDASALPFEEEVIKNYLRKGWLRSWVQIPPGPSLPVVRVDLNDR